MTDNELGNKGQPTTRPLANEWIIHEKVRVSKEWDNVSYTSLSSRQQAELTIEELLELIGGKGAAVIQYDGTNPIYLTLVDPRSDIDRD
ncbi:MAG: hypothetical protein KAQ99_00780 [Candidatus Aureabacteria bacterium]|nr:hypothetical protein [Candidatus Auribacterota bacterium]